jgi:pimeloyl-ACP methyl ester carboxylesterase
MDRVEFDDVQVDFEVRGEGEHVVLVHASAFVSWYTPLVERLADHSTVTYRRHIRRPAGGSYRPLSAAEDAATCARLLEHLGWPTAHIVGHSYGALVALQMALDTPDRVASVALLEPAARGISSSDAIAAALQPVIGAYRAGDTAAAIDGFLRHVCGDDYQATLQRVVPGAFAEALAEADLFFQAEMAAVQQFAFGPDDASRITQPVLNVVGAHSVPRFIEGNALVQSWFPGAERLTIPAAGHLLMIQNPTDVAGGLKDYFSRHPITSRGSVPA